jgi:hypothetical protein
MLEERKVDVCFDLDSLDRALQEVEALLLIYGQDDDDDNDDAAGHSGDDDDDVLSSNRARLVLKSSLEEMERVRSFLVEQQSGKTASVPPTPPPQQQQQQQRPTISLEMHLRVKGENDIDGNSAKNDIASSKTKSIKVCLYLFWSSSRISFSSTRDGHCADGPRNAEEG